MSEQKKQETGQPQDLTAEELDQVSGGLLPAVKAGDVAQKVQPGGVNVHPGGVNVLMGDGSVRFVK